MPNRLANETSPYLQQHAENPVDWYPWGADALERARAEDKPILLSVGYSACHWCHVMAHESFEDADVAAVMNRLFVNVKVDREERPDIDQIYQSAHQLLTRRAGGWPLTMFLTPDQTPFFGGTYFPKVPRHNLPGFAALCERVAQVYREQREGIAAQNDELVRALRDSVPIGDDAPIPGDEAIARALDELDRVFDRAHGGLGNAPKFPHPAELELALSHGAIIDAPQLMHIAIFTLERMALGGIYDQIGGGFCRYSTDAQWRIPHFEKMLYDNGPLLRLYADAWALTGNPLFEQVVRETAQWVIREMQAADGGYTSSLDADSEGEEGRFYVWSRDDVRALLSPDEYSVLAPHYGLEGPPNFEKRAWHLHVAEDLDAIAARLRLSTDAVRAILDAGRAKLFAARERRVRPARDDKVLTSWNALMIEGMARAGRVFGETAWLDSARRALAFLRERMWNAGRLLATYKDGKAHLNAYLDDHAFLLAAVIEMLQSELRADDLAFARDLADALVARFADREAGGFYFTSHDHEALIVRGKPGHDNATPSGNGVAALGLQRLGHLLGEPRYLDAATATLRLFGAQFEAHPAGFATLAMALREQVQPTRVIVLRGQRPQVEAWQRGLAARYLPATLVAAAPVDLGRLPGALDKPESGPVNAWICQGVSCLPPIDEWARLLEVAAGDR